MIFLKSFLLSLLFATSAQALTCHVLFSKKAIETVPYLQVYAGQEHVGQDYAIFKELRDAGLNPQIPLYQLSKQDRAQLIASVQRNLTESIPAVRDPQGRLFLLDGHHTLYVATRLFQNLSLIKIQVEIIFDATKTEMSWQDFSQKAIAEHWFYTNSAKSILENPRHVHELSNSVERSMLGFFFISIEDKYQVPMKGKYFKPFIQFYLADFIKDHDIYIFSTMVDLNEVAKLRKILLKNPLVVEFLISQLRPDAPKLLRDFLLNQ